MANVQVAIGFWWESGDNLAPRSLEVGLQLGSSVGNAHLPTPCLLAECHHLVYLPIT